MIVTLNFAGLKGDASEYVLDYYNGGTGSESSAGGPALNYGINFGGDALIASGQPGGLANTALIPGGTGANALFFLTGTGDTMNISGGFRNSLSFYYTSPYNPGSLQLWSGVNGTGTQIGSNITLPVTTDGTNTTGCLGQPFCPYYPFSVSFAGTAKSVIFSGSANYVAFAAITLDLGVATTGTTQYLIFSEVG